MERRYLTSFNLEKLPRCESDVLVIGSGIAGLYTALLLGQHLQVTLLTKGPLTESNTEYAQGGIAAALGAEDSPDLHFRDTLEAGAGLCDEAAVRVLVDEGPACVRDLIRLGTRFDQLETGAYALTREGAHSQSRILHAHGDSTGREIRETLEARLREAGVSIFENQFGIDLITVDGRCVGALCRDEQGRKRAFLARAAVLATGGAGQLYLNTTNPLVATGDGIAMAYRAGAEVQDMEFVQFHPTALHGKGNPQFLISEAVRGEGAHLLNSWGERFMERYHPHRELAPRDVVARAILDQMQRSGDPCVYLDARALPDFSRRFPRIWQACRDYGVDPARERIPVSPAAHYLMGGVRTDLHGRTSLPGLYACGEVACTGVHGANRLASNSLLEGLVFGRRIAEVLLADLPARLPPDSAEHYHSPDAGPHQELTELLRQVQRSMWDEVGIRRHGRGLHEALQRQEQVLESLLGSLATTEACEVANLALVGALVARAALDRTESRGGHFRTDFPERDDQRWRRHVVQRRINP